VFTRGIHLAIAALSCAALTALSPCPAARADAPAPPHRPRIGLVLSGGGARGAAHVGVLKVLEERHVPIDYLAGTSMGALVGGLYASGMTPDSIEQVLNTVDWADAFVDAIPRGERSFHCKRDDDLILLPHKPGLRGGHLVFPPGLIDGQKIDLLLKRLTLPVICIRSFDELPIPYRAVAADIVTGEAVILDHGDLAVALRSSMAIPAAFAPREIDGRLLVDGGITDNLPIEVVRRMGADIVIAVDIGTPMQERSQIQSVMSIALQLTSFMSDRNAKRQIATLHGRDVFLRPDLGTITTASFDRAAEAVPIGYRAAQAAAAQLDSLAVSEAEWRASLARRSLRAERIEVDRVRLVNHSRLGDDVLARRLGPLAGAPLDPVQLESAIDEMYGLELFESVYYDVRPDAGRNVLELRARERSWGPNYLQVGAAAFEDYEAPAFDVAVAYERTAINRRAGEWRTALQLGRDPGAFTEWHQPLDRTLRSFARARAAAEEMPVNVFDASGTKAGEVEVRRTGIEVSVGRGLGSWGEARAGVLCESGRIAARVGLPPAPDRHFGTGDAFLQLAVDRLDEVDFPRAGGSASGRLTEGRRALGSDTRYEQVCVAGVGARTFGRTTARVAGLLGSTLDGVAPVQAQFALGGFGRLSGLERDERFGPHVALVGVAAYRCLTGFPLPSLFVGVTGEYGNVYPRQEAIRLNDGIASAAAFLGTHTFLGPILLAYGLAEGGRTNYYVGFGEAFHPRRPTFRRG
jgi:NTE family protein